MGRFCRLLEEIYPRNDQAIESPSDLHRRMEMKKQPSQRVPRFRNSGAAHLQLVLDKSRRGTRLVFPPTAELATVKLLRSLASAILYVSPSPHRLPE